LITSKNAAILRDFLIFQTSQHQKMQQFCVTSSFFKLDNIKNATILRDFLIFEVDKIKNEAILRHFFIL